MVIYCVVADNVGGMVFVLAILLHTVIRFQMRWLGGTRDVNSAKFLETYTLYHSNVTQAFESYPDDIWIKHTRIDKIGTHLREEETVAVDVPMSLLVLFG